MVKGSLDWEALSGLVKELGRVGCRYRWRGWGVRSVEEEEGRAGSVGWGDCDGGGGVEVREVGGEVSRIGVANGGAVDSLVGVSDQVHCSSVGKYGIEFSGYLESMVVQRDLKVGQVRWELAWAEPWPQETHDGALVGLQAEVWWLALAQCAHRSVFEQVSLMWP